MRRALLPVLLCLPSVAHAQAPVRAGGEFRVNTSTYSSQGDSANSADAAGRFVVVWTSPERYGSGTAIYGQRFDAAGARIGGEFMVNQYTTGHQVTASVAAAPDGRFMVTWASNGQDGSGYGVFARAYRADGRPAGPEFAVNGVTTGDQFAPDVAVIPGGFVVAWSDYDSGSHVSRIVGGVFDRNGDRVGSDFQVATPSTSYGFSGPAVAGLPNGAYVVAWASGGIDGGHVWYRFHDTGGPVGLQRLADTQWSPFPSSLWRSTPDVAVRDDGSFVLAWDLTTCVYGTCLEAYEQARDFDPAGWPVAPEFQLNASSVVDATDPQLAVGVRGIPFATWGNQARDGSQGEVMARRFGAVAPSPDFVVNTYMPGWQGQPAVASDPAGNVLVTWTSVGQDGSWGGVYAQRFGGLVPSALDVDTSRNHVLEPGESVDVRPLWRNVAGSAQAFSGTFSGLTGPLPGNGYYTLTDGVGDYGTAPDGATVSCNDCYGVSIADLQRPSVHWDASVVETISPDSQGQQVRWPLHIGNSFGDVPSSSPYYRYIETLLHRGVTAGCAATTYCPADPTTREAMAVFVLVAKEGAGYSPRACVPPNLFNDVPETSPFCRYIEELANRGVVGGCAANQYCGSAPVTREQMAVFVLRTLDPTLDPPACAAPNMFGDLPETSPFCRWVEELARRGIVAGCGGGNYCGGAAVTREQMGVFLGVTFGLTLYGV